MGFLCYQTEAMEADGFQADTEEDDEDDCVIVSTQSGKFLADGNLFKHPSLSIE